MKTLFTLSLAAILLASCGRQEGSVTLTVVNPSDMERAGELVEVPLAGLTRRLNLPDTARLVVRDEAGRELPTQTTYDGKLLFAASLLPRDTARYTVQAGIPASVAVQARGRVYPERLDDLAWENDLVAFRAYGPALQATGERGYGYDLLAKRGTDMPVLDERYALDLNPATRARIDSLRKADPAAADSLARSTSYHVDHGNGMDCYAVGPTLGGGTTALLDGEGQIAYPWCYRTCEVLENGPLRFAARLTFNPLQVDGDTSVVETRLITLETGSYLNRTEVVYEGLSRPTPLVTGIVLHDDTGGMAMEKEPGYMAYADPTTGSGNGKLFVGAVFPDPVQEITADRFSAAEQKQRAGAKGHLLAYSTYRPGTKFVYYWGFAWDRATGKDFEAWKKYLARKAEQLRHPLVVTVD